MNKHLLLALSSLVALLALANSPLQADPISDSTPVPPPIRVNQYHGLFFESLSYKDLFARPKAYFIQYERNQFRRPRALNVLAIGDSWFTYTDPGGGALSPNPLPVNTLQWLSIMGKDYPTQGFNHVFPRRDFGTGKPPRFKGLADKFKAQYSALPLFILALSNNGEITANMAGRVAESYLDIDDAIQREIDVQQVMSQSIEFVKARGARFDYVLLSGGGNDILNPLKLKGILKYRYCNKANKDFLSNSECYDYPKLNTYLDNVVYAYDTMINNLQAKQPGIQVFAHTYDYLVPYPVGPTIFYRLKFGKQGWIFPIVKEYGITEPRDQFKLVYGMLNVFKTLLKTLEAKYPGTFHVVDTHGVTYLGDYPALTKAEVENELLKKGQGLDLEQQGKYVRLVRRVQVQPSAGNLPPQYQVVPAESPSDETLFKILAHNELCYRHPEFPRENYPGCNWRNEIHPNIYGFMQVAEALYEAIKKQEIPKNPSKEPVTLNPLEDF